MTDECWFPKVEPPGKKSNKAFDNDKYIANGRFVWHSKDGRNTSLWEMDATRIRSCISKIESIAHKGGMWRAEWIPRLEMELAFRKVIKEELGLSSGVVITPSLRKTYEADYAAKQRRSLPDSWSAEAFYNGPGDPYRRRFASSKLERSDSEKLESWQEEALMFDRTQELKSAEYTYRQMIGVDGSVINVKIPT